MTVAMLLHNTLINFQQSLPSESHAASPATATTMLARNTSFGDSAGVGGGGGNSTSPSLMTVNVSDDVTAKALFVAKHL
jgi:hypothetical protein